MPLLDVFHDGCTFLALSPQAVADSLRLIAQTFQLASISRLRNSDFGTRYRALAQFSQPSSLENFKSTAIDETIGGGCARMGMKRKAPKSALDFYVQKIYPIARKKRISPGYFKSVNRDDRQRDFV